MYKKHKHKNLEEHIDESWLIPYADLLTLLLALFIVLFAMSSLDAKKFEEMSKAFGSALSSGKGIPDKSNAIIVSDDWIGSKSRVSRESSGNQQQEENDRQIEKLMNEEQAKLGKIRNQIDQYIQSKGLTTQLDTILDESQLTITIRDNALFQSGQAIVKPESRKLAIAISKILEQYPEYEIIVAGHTDNLPISTKQFKSNWDLSAKRALRFMDIMLMNKNLDPERFSAIGYSEFRPIASNATDAGRAKNRRVEVTIVRKIVVDQNRN
ncbi:flagellar motor protein MotB [Paenibacillus spongiae]|uniref:Flagellar motor protein MotB n=1 Tax=Paenibacillus spongiae TaxID=2909671 RepID=A0ABY5SL98_9BACL|nr:flagellar motor protein MotB [Paenibacillus spongiae]UVI33445.1 flagellar motor protein MotB [Paenibacillus spongiae]